MERKNRRKRKRNFKKSTENINTTILMGTVVFFISTRFYTFIFVYISYYKNRRDIADIQSVKRTGISAVFIFASLARPPPHFGLFSKNFKSEVEKNGLQQSKRGKEVEVMERI